MDRSIIVFFYMFFGVYWVRVGMIRSLDINGWKIEIEMDVVVVKSRWVCIPYVDDKCAETITSLFKLPNG